MAAGPLFGGIIQSELNRKKPIASPLSGAAVCRSLGHFQSPKSSIIAAVGEAGPQMLFAAQEGELPEHQPQLYCGALHGSESKLKGQHFSTLG